MGDSDKAVERGTAAVGEMTSAMGAVDTAMHSVIEQSEQIAQTLKRQIDISFNIAEGIGGISEHTAGTSDALENIIDAMELSHAALVAGITRLAGYDLPAKVIRIAQSDHAVWKKRLAAMIIGRDGLNAHELSDQHSCRLGKWYDAVGDAGLRSNPDFIALAAPHAAVHRIGIEAVRLYNANDVAGAVAKLELVDTASKQVLALLRSLETAQLRAEIDPAA